MKPITLITGGAGFIGPHLCEWLVAAGEEILWLDNFYTGNKDNIRMPDSSGNCWTNRCRCKAKTHCPRFKRLRSSYQTMPKRITTPASFKELDAVKISGSN
jgi:nucleoside-diphosphate-sugar epimerase